MKRGEGLIFEDGMSNRLVAVWYDPTTRLFLKQGLRVGKDCPLSPELRRIYVKEGKVACIKAIRMITGCGLWDAYDMVRSAELGTKEREEPQAH
jgi:hypothetical protein